MSKHNSMNQETTLAHILGDEMPSVEADQIIRRDYETYQTYLTFPEDVQKKILEFIQGQRWKSCDYGHCGSEQGWFYY